ncbi:rhodanese-like domain-containing protein [Aequorivita sp. H23M31]|uniref:Rhodanese-like domain-containing protein n=1 Tax=Aequorivita ciconiae TaxID=2494375 RepID=A0A410G676_9FLAO|nr:rhodanese-like domain-containing protein [Aequorivita sp. H23M31]QAA82731.1 rhodanese-like domain-containing protein [Aequorivita sp. H23M31]
MIKKNIVSIVALSLLFFFTACKDTSSAKEIKVISPQEVKEAVYDDAPHQLVDVRTLEEFKEGHLKNAQNICVTDDDFAKQIEKLDKDEPIYVYCRSGKRSAKAAQILKDKGFKEIYDMDGGYLNWESQRFDTEL